MPPRRRMRPQPATTARLQRHAVGRPRCPGRAPPAPTRPRNRRSRKNRPSDRQPHMRIKRHAVGPSHAHESQVDPESRCQPKQQQRAGSPNPGRRPLDAGGQSKEKNAGAYSQQRMQQGIRYIKERGTAKGSKVGAVENEDSHSRGEEPASPQAARAFVFHALFSLALILPRPDAVCTLTGTRRFQWLQSTERAFFHISHQLSFHYGSEATNISRRRGKAGARLPTRG